VAGAFADALAGGKSTRELGSQLARMAPQGVTEGLIVAECYLTVSVLQ
jgi:hypothetical protein